MFGALVDLAVDTTIGVTKVAAKTTVKGLDPEMYVDFAENVLNKGEEICDKIDEAIDGVFE